MATRPFITAQNLIDYSDFPAVQTRATDKLDIDICRAEAAIIDYVGHNFSDADKYPDAPKNLTIAVKLLAERYAIRATKERNAEGFKSEKFDDYQYTRFDGDPINALEIGYLLNDFIEDGSTGQPKAIFKMRVL